MSAALELETKREPVLPKRGELSKIRSIERLLGASSQQTAKLVGPDGKAMQLPTSVYKLLKQLVEELARGNAVTVVPVHAELTTQQAADLLNVSRPHLVQLLEKGEMPFQRVGTHRRVRFDDLMVYRQKRSQGRREFFKEMLQEAQETGMYGED